MDKITEFMQWLAFFVSAIGSVALLVYFTLDAFIISGNVMMYFVGMAFLAVLIIFIALMLKAWKGLL